MRSIAVTICAMCIPFHRPAGRGSLCLDSVESKEDFATKSGSASGTMFVKRCFFKAFTDRGLRHETYTGLVGLLLRDLVEHSSRLSALRKWHCHFASLKRLF